MPTLVLWRSESPHPNDGQAALAEAALPPLRYQKRQRTPSMRGRWDSCRMAKVTRFLFVLLGGFNASKTDMIGGAVRLPFTSAARHVARAIVVAAQKRAAALDALGHARFAGIVAGIRPLGVAGRLSKIARLIPIAAPFPDIAGHVGKAEAVGGERAYRGCAEVAVLQR